jgi:diphthamide biosynthesis methyltransferase
VSEDAEISLVVKLKRVCDKQFVVLERMDVDMKTSKEMFDRNMDNEMDFVYGSKPIIWRVYC